MKNVFKIHYVVLVLIVFQLGIFSNAEQSVKPERLKCEAVQFDKDTRLKIQEERLGQIAAIAQDKCEEIEKNYSYRLSQLQLWVMNSLEHLDMPAKILWAEILKSYGDLCYTDSYLGQQYVLTANANIFDPLPYLCGKHQTRQMLSEILSMTSHGVTPDFLYDEWAFEQGRKPTRVRGIFKIEDIREIQILFAIIKEFDSRLSDIERQKQQQIEEITCWEQNQKENVEHIINGIKTPVQEYQVGIVTAICIDDSGAECMIEGSEEPLLKAGDKINNVTIQKILPDKVEFKKGSRTWTQKIGESANKAWL